MADDDSNEADRRADEAWENIKKGGWSHWVTIGQALVRARTVAMNQAGVNHPNGGPYRRAFNRVLEPRAFAKMDGGDRHRLFECMEHLDEIQAWRATLTEGERIRLNHPSAVVRRWKRKAVAPRAPKKPTVRTQLAMALEKLDAMERRGEGSLFDRTSTAKDVARVLNGTYPTEAKRKAIIKEWAALAKASVKDKSSG